MSTRVRRESSPSGEEDPFIGISMDPVAKPSFVSEVNNTSSNNYTINPQRRLNTNKPLWPQAKIMISVWICNIAAGMSFGHSAVLLPELQKANSSIIIDENTGSWIASAYALAGPAGTFFAGIFMDMCGRRWNNIIAGAAMCIGWLFILVAQEAVMILFGRIIEGFSRTMLYTGISVIIDELSDPKYRGFIMGCCGTFASIGILIISNLGASVDWRAATSISAAASSVSLVTFLFVAESPTWLVRKNRMMEASRSLEWIWGPDRHLKVQEELQDLQARYQPEENMKREHNSFSDKINKYITIYRNFFTPPVLKPFVIILVFNVVQPLCGHTLFMFYAVDILSRIKRTDTEIMNENHETVLLSSVRVFFVTLSSFCLFRYGRRQIGVISGIGASLSGIFIASILYLNTLDRDSPIPPQIEAWLTFLIITLFVGSHSFGFYMLPPLMIGETQPAHVRSYLCGCIYTINDLIFGSVVKSYPLIVRSVDVHGMFLIFGMSCLICTIFIYLFLPETQGKSLMEIEDYFRGKNIMWISRNNNCNDNGDVFATRQRQK